MTSLHPNSLELHSPPAIAKPVPPPAAAVDLEKYAIRDTPAQTEMAQFQQYRNKNARPH
jgi:hypothetical protein